jgi:hypothetical protein
MLERFHEIILISSNLRVLLLITQFRLILQLPQEYLSYVIWKAIPLIINTIQRPYILPYWPRNNTNEHTIAN